MKITTAVEGQLWKLAVATLGTLALEQLVVELLKGCVKTRAVNMYGFYALNGLVRKR